MDRMSYRMFCRGGRRRYGRVVVIDRSSPINGMTVPYHLKTRSFSSPLDNGDDADADDDDDSDDGGDRNNDF